jgi:hypothetical protein
MRARAVGAPLGPLGIASSNRVELEPNIIIEQRHVRVLLIELLQSGFWKFGEAAPPFGIALSSEDCLTVSVNPQFNSRTPVSLLSAETHCATGCIIRNEALPNPTIRANESGLRWVGQCGLTFQKYISA